MIKEEKITSMNKSVYIDIIRILACFMVIINHTNDLILEDNRFSSATFYCITFALCKIGVPLFFMITGALSLDKNYTYKKILKNIVHVAVPVFVLSLLLYIKDAGLSNFNPLYFFKSIIAEPYRMPYWYVYALIGAYLTIPFLQKMVQHFKNKDYILFVVFFLFVPSIFHNLRLYLDFHVNYYFLVSFFPTVIAFLICGNFLFKLEITKKHFIISIVTFLISYALMFLSLYLPYIHDNAISYTLDSWDAFPVILMSISIFIIIKYLLRNNISSKVARILSIISSTTFGIYLIHFLLNHKLYHLGFMKSIFAFNSILGILLLDVLVFVVCMIITYILKKIPVIKKFL